MLAGNDVIDFKRSVIDCLRRPAIFSLVLCLLPNGPGKCRTHESGYETLRVLSLTPSVRRALDLRMESTVDDRPKACIWGVIRGISGGQG
jgi:hypothetical protein